MGYHYSYDPYTNLKFQGYMKACDLSEKCYMEDMEAMVWGILTFWLIFFLVLIFSMKMCLK